MYAHRVSSMQSRSTIIVLSLVLIGLFASGVFLYYRVFVAQNYPVEIRVSCDPAQEQCFVEDCSHDDSCTGDAIEEKTYYKKITLPAGMTQGCDDACLMRLCVITEGCTPVLCAPDQDVTCASPTETVQDSALSAEEERNMNED